MPKTLALVTVVVSLAVAAGCAKKPATVGASAPAPTGSVVGAARPGTATSGLASSSPQTPASPAAPQSTRSEARPKAGDFVAVGDLVDVHFDFDKYDIRPDAARVIEANARFLRARNDDAILVEGHCDERGTSEYNLALGERRATAARNALVARGVDARRITIVSYGEDRPQCRDASEGCWAKNRRARFLVKPR